MDIKCVQNTSMIHIKQGCSSSACHLHVFSFTLCKCVCVYVCACACICVCVFVCVFSDNFYGTPKPPAEPSPLLLNVTDQILPGHRPSSEGKRKRNKSVSNMEKAGIDPPEEEEEERPVVNGNGVAVTPGQPLQSPPSRQRVIVASPR